MCANKVIRGPSGSYGSLDNEDASYTNTEQASTRRKAEDTKLFSTHHKRHKWTGAATKHFNNTQPSIVSNPRYSVYLVNKQPAVQHKSLSIQLLTKSLLFAFIKKKWHIGKKQKMCCVQMYRLKEQQSLNKLLFRQKENRVSVILPVDVQKWWGGHPAPSPQNTMSPPKKKIKTTQRMEQRVVDLWKKWWVNTGEQKLLTKSKLSLSSDSLPPPRV